MENRDAIETGKTSLGIELGSTRIKGVLINEAFEVIADGVWDWENRLENGIWTYSLEDVWTGLQGCYRDLAESVRKKYGIDLKVTGSIGISAMQHGYMPFDREGNLLTPFRTWRNTITKEAAEKLTDLFQYNIPQRWSIAHVYQAVLNGEKHVDQIAHLDTLDSYVHRMLTGRMVTGIGDGSGMFPIDTDKKTYDPKMIALFNDLPEIKELPWKIEELLPTPLLAGEDAGVLTEEGARLLDPSGILQSGIPLCPPEGDGTTGMVATNAVSPRTGNVSAGTSDFAILILEKELSRVYREIDLVTSPTGRLAANVHCNNCTTDINQWTHLFGEFAEAVGISADPDVLFPLLYSKALEGDKDAGGLVSFNYYSGEGITDFDEGRPLMLRLPDSSLTLANVMRMHLYSAVATLRAGMDIITQKERMTFDRIMGHGGYFKTPLAGQTILSAALNMPVTVMETAGQGGPWGMALLAAYHRDRSGRVFEDWLENVVFAGEEGSTVMASGEDVEGFNRYFKRFAACLDVEREAVRALRSDMD